MNRTDGIPKNSDSSTSCADSHSRPRTSLGCSKDLTRLAPRFEGRKSAEFMCGGIVEMEVRWVPTKVPYHPFNYRKAAAIFIRVVLRHGKVTMRYWMKPLTAPPGGKRWS
ncbi:hypothetical protein AVEN_207485-1 [Araneus ventricosus]|uniref:Uncharacterized protein n=1 Tax=Araneus ventricosus TaxID=182803 RepID=A0A4Y2EDD6_ARAVE|nr:hypothetical protein AVEN_207485-1 [Araneus ventricosus]